MATDDERREVAVALRAYDGSGATADTIGEITALIIGAGDDEGWTWAQVYARLVDLIDPDCEEGRYEGVRTARPMDRGALMALAEEMETKEPDFGSSSSNPNPPYVRTVYAALLPIYAHRIREACGEAANGVPTGRRVSGCGEAAGPQAGGSSGRPCAVARAAKYYVSGDGVRA